MPEGKRRDGKCPACHRDGCRDHSWSVSCLRNLSKQKKKRGLTRRTFLGTDPGQWSGADGGTANAVFGRDLTDADRIGDGDSIWKLGGDLPVHRLGFGAMRITGEGIWGWPADRANALKVLRRAVELGVNLIDTADAYGPETSELLIAEALHPYPKGLVIATKGGLTRPGPDQWAPNGRPEYLKQCVDKSLQRLKLDRIDLYQLHRIDPKVPAEDSLGALKEMQDAGKIRHVGLSEVSPQQIQRAREILPIVTVQNQYNVGDRDWENTLLYCEKEKLGFMPWSPIGGSRGLKNSGALEATAKAHKTSTISGRARLAFATFARDASDSRHFVASRTWKKMSRRLRLN